MQPAPLRLARVAAAALGAAALVLGLVLGLSACGSKPPRRASSAPASRVVEADHWTPPRADGTPSTAGFCKLLVADYQHVNTLVEAPKLSVRERIVKDYVSFAPRVQSAAPPQIAPAAHLYLSSVATVMRDLLKAGLDPTKVTGTQAAHLVTNPAVVAAGQQLMAFSARYCHYEIAG